MDHVGLVLEVNGVAIPLKNDAWVTLSINGNQFAAFDCFYLDPNEEDPYSPYDGEPHLVFGETENDNEGTWARLREWSVAGLTAPRRWE
jgi:hypothetical protein